MNPQARSYGYVGPAELRATVREVSEGHTIRSAADLEAWVTGRDADEALEPFTYVVGLDGFLRLAPRRSEHVACAGGRRVLAAGEMTLGRASGQWTAQEVSNQSTGYCPDLDSWPAVAAALDRAGVRHPGRFTHEVVFRRCERCVECNIVREGDFVCVFCGADLPLRWNVAP
ncbi:hypothetical protein [Streptomyces cylindrosporus]|uniref:Zinc ribbon domain-containing protein n=1 Tax=Streptomyces cylindrosporus TaxID=2927583 RepID=A0ABS9YDB3_9ACTN|nr:hypothetical protein [Streptomyces cylindrosporus]MCI3275214.1 hypothetical protein [Streptomyces cylindrosporus]